MGLKLRRLTPASERTELRDRRLVMYVTAEEEECVKELASERRLDVSSYLRKKALSD